jgi:hypothetical protein
MRSRQPIDQYTGEAWLLQYKLASVAIRLGFPCPITPIGGCFCAQPIRAAVSSALAGLRGGRLALRPAARAGAGLHA